MNGSKNYGIFTWWNTTQQIERSSYSLEQMDGSGEHYAKPYKPGNERQIYDLTYKWNLIKKTNNQAECNQGHWN